jgi:hypothetical protein
MENKNMKRLMMTGLGLVLVVPGFAADPTTFYLMSDPGLVPYPVNLKPWCLTITNEDSVSILDVGQGGQRVQRKGHKVGAISEFGDGAGDEPGVSDMVHDEFGSCSAQWDAGNQFHDSRRGTSQDLCGGDGRPDEWLLFPNLPGQVNRAGVKADCEFEDVFSEAGLGDAEGD